LPSARTSSVERFQVTRSARRRLPSLVMRTSPLAVTSSASVS
jgi:hypothetical protein